MKKLIKTVGKVMYGVYSKETIEELNADINELINSRRIFKVGTETYDTLSRRIDELTKMRNDIVNMMFNYSEALAIWHTYPGT